MKIIYKGKKRKKKKSYYWRCSECGTIGYHEENDGYVGFCGNLFYFRCPVCTERIYESGFFGNLWARLLMYIYLPLKKSESQ